MTTAEAPKKIKITMSERRPLSIVEDEWPVIAQADWHNGQVECQANTIRRIKVREHADGRRLVYGFARAGSGGQYAGTRNPEGGFLVAAKVCWPVPSPDEDETVRAIRRVGGIIDDDGLADECIADLPAEDDESPAAAATSVRGLAEAIRMLAIIRDDVRRARFDDVSADQQRNIAAALDDMAAAEGRLQSVLTVA